ncbi:Hypothetical_protein [Hexamita inflata]|uniref:Hypothetical_protein n=1 Tax=Hexamita inflata TaxID=28002 RepID=A0AA86UI45_9EUKA|nr:Hypothetical protein HINF_LOCUS39722 [Hexamita inflata]
MEITQMTEPQTKKDISEIYQNELYLSQILFYDKQTAYITLKTVSTLKTCHEVGMLHCHHFTPNPGQIQGVMFGVSACTYQQFSRHAVYMANLHLPDDSLMQAHANQHQLIYEVKTDPKTLQLQEFGVINPKYVELFNMEPGQIFMDYTFVRIFNQNYQINVLTMQLSSKFTAVLGAYVFRNHLEYSKTVSGCEKGRIYYSANVLVLTRRMDPINPQQVLAKLLISFF